MPQRFAERLSGDTAKFAVFCFFVACVFLMGGGSRADILSLVLLRPIAFLAGAYALLVAGPGQLRAVGWPLGLMTVLLAIIALQLVPLPPEIWTALPGRQLYAQIAADAGTPLGYRPLTLAPSRTLNALFSLIIPISSVLIIAVQSDHYRSRLFTVLLIASVASALLAIAQMAGSNNSVLYLYRVTNSDFPVGLFANRNHQALLMVMLLVLIADFSRRAQRGGSAGALPNIGIAFAALVIFALILVAGSRAGLLLGVMVVPVIAWMHARNQRQITGAPKAKDSRGWWALIGVGLVALIGGTIALSRAASFERLWADDALSDYRFERLSILVEMLKDHWVFGIGFGAFEGVFKRYEAVEVLTPFIFNQAHNDFIQFPIEGGIPAIALLLAVLVWLATQAIRLVRSARTKFDANRFVALLILILLALSSSVDYPLRVPIFMLIGAVAFTELWRRSGHEKAE